MIRLRLFYIISFCCIYFYSIKCQNLTGILKGKVIDKESQNPLSGATVVILGTVPQLGASCDTNGLFTIKNVPIGRYNIKVSCIGYNDIIINEIFISSGKETFLNVELSEKTINMDEVVVKINKMNPINSMAIVSTTQISVEEANRYAGGFDDPARLVTSYAGVTGSLSNNGIVIRGNAPKGLLWRMEGVEIPNPSHFANVSSLGAGAITALSSQMLANSDFYTGAFPAEYGNVISGVFDLKLRNGNNDKYESTFQLGLIGTDISVEGPFIKGKESSFLFNYRYSTLTLLAPILPEEMGKLKYQDLCFKLNFPIKKFGTFSIWGLGALDYQGRNAKTDSSLWNSDIDKQKYSSYLNFFAIGLNYKISLNKKTFITSSIVTSGNGIELSEEELNKDFQLYTKGKIENINNKYIFTTYINHKFNSKHNNKTGIIINRLQYNINIRSLNENNVLSSFAEENGNSYLIQAFSQSKYNFKEQLFFVAGLHFIYFTLNGNYNLEPRIGFKWKFKQYKTLGISYGLHSQLEPLNFYFVRMISNSDITQPNKHLDFTKAHHLVLLYEIQIDENKIIKFEPYYQRLFNVPVIPGTNFSLQNLENTIYFNDSLINKGTGRNIGIDITFQRFLNKGVYYLITASFFDSRYRGDDGILRNARFNKHYVVNILGGKEWLVGKNNFINISGKLCLIGGDHYTPLDINATYQTKTIIEDNSRAFTVRKPDAPILSFAFNYKINKPNYTSIFSFSFINALFYKEFNRFYFDKTTNSIKKDINQLVVPNLSYKIEF